jgi:GntP family gluconate:H+ symporter
MVIGHYQGCEKHNSRRMIQAPSIGKELPFHPVYLALAIGCGSKPFPWMNDSGFWVVCQMSGMTEGETLRTFSSVLSIMGFIGLFVVMILARLFPFT